MPHFGDREGCGRGKRDVSAFNITLPEFSSGFAREKEIQELKDYIFMLTKQLKYTLANIEPEENFTKEASKEWENKATNDYVTSSISQKADEILLTVSREYATEKNMQSSISQKADEILLTVSKEYATNSTVRSMLQTTEDNILLEVSDTYATEEDMLERFSQLDVTVDGINTAVSKKVGQDEIISRINQSAESVTIDAKKINLKGITFADEIQILKKYVNGSSSLVLSPGDITLGDSSSDHKSTVKITDINGMVMTEAASGTENGTWGRFSSWCIDLQENSGPYPRYWMQIYPGEIICRTKASGTASWKIKWDSSKFSTL